MLPKWLTKLQQESWQAEILLSGLILFSLLKAPEGLRQLHDWARNEMYYQEDMRNLAILLTLASYGLITGFILHLILRGIWVGYVGLSYVFPDGANLSRLKLSPRFRLALRSMQRPEQQVMKLESVCSALFGLSFYFFMCLIGAALYVILTALIIIVLFEWFRDTALMWIPITFFYIFSLSALLYFIDFLTLGSLKRARWLSRFYYPVYRVMSLLTLAHWYRNIYYLFVSRLKGWVIVLFILLYTFITIALFIQEEQRFFNIKDSMLLLYPAQGQGVAIMNANLYADTMEDPFGVTAYLSSETVQNGLLRLVIVHRYKADQEAAEKCNISAAAKRPDPEEQLRCLSAYYRIVLDMDTLPPQPLNFYHDNLTEHKSLLSYLKLDTLAEGRHVLSVVAGDDVYATIPFFFYPKD